MLCVIDLEWSCVPEGLFDFRFALVDFLILLDKFNDIGNTLTCLNKSFNAAVGSAQSRLLPSNSFCACSSSHQAPITGLMLNSDSWLGVIRRVAMLVG